MMIVVASLGIVRGHRGPAIRSAFPIALMMIHASGRHAEPDDDFGMVRRSRILVTAGS